MNPDKKFVQTEATAPKSAPITSTTGDKFIVSCSKCGASDLLSIDHIDKYKCKKCSNTVFNVSYRCSTCNKIYTISKVKFIVLRIKKFVECPTCGEEIQLLKE